MTADLLRRAAARIRETARAAQAVAPTPWRADPETARTSRPADCYDVLDNNSGDVVVSVTHPEAVHIATWGPDIAELVAEVLEAAADRVHAGALLVAPSVTGRLVALARRILEEDA